MSQKRKENMQETTPYKNETSIKLEKAAAKFNLRILVKPNPSIFQRIKFNNL